MIHPMWPDHAAGFGVTSVLEVRKISARALKTVSLQNAVLLWDSSTN